jgi:hypothetical protein
MATLDQARSVASGLPRSTEALVRGRVKFRVGRIVYVSFSHDETVMGFAFPKEWREALVESEPHKFMLPSASDLRYHWVLVDPRVDRRGRAARSRRRRVGDGRPEERRRCLRSLAR